MYIFMLMGYEKVSEDILVLKQQSSSYDSLVYVACECFIAAVECLVMTQIWEKVDEDKYAALDVYRSRMEVRGDIDQCATWVVQHCVAKPLPPNRKPQQQYAAAAATASVSHQEYNNETTSTGSASLNRYRHHHYNISNTTTNVNNNTGAKPKTTTSNANSLNNSSTDGVRSKKSGKASGSKSPSLTKKSRDSGYSSKSASKELPDIAPGRLRSDDIPPEALYGHQVNKHI